MCGRFGLWAEPGQIEDHFRVQPPSLSPFIRVSLEDIVFVEILALAVIMFVIYIAFFEKK